MKKHNKRKYIGSYKTIVTGGLATFLILGLTGCDGSNESKATKKQKCKLQSYKEEHLEECKDLENTEIMYEEYKKLFITTTEECSEP